MSDEITRLLHQWQTGDQQALDELMALVYRELHTLAGSYLRRERPNHTLQPTALVHEAYLRLVDENRINWQSRAHFFGVTAQVMRNILVDHARARHRDKRGGYAEKLSLDEALGVFQKQDVDVIALDDALQELAGFDPQQSRLVELRFFGGLTIEETAEVLGMSPATVKREWTLAKAWLHQQLVPDER